MTERTAEVQVLLRRFSVCQHGCVLYYNSTARLFYGRISSLLSFPQNARQCLNANLLSEMLSRPTSVIPVQHYNILYRYIILVYMYTKFKTGTWARVLQDVRLFAASHHPREKYYAPRPLSFGSLKKSRKRALFCVAEDCSRWLCWHNASIADASTRGNILSGGYEFRKVHCYY